MIYRHCLKNSPSNTMKKITIAMEDNTQEWLRAQAAREHISVSHCLRNLVDQARARDASSELPFKKFKRQPGSLKGQIWLADDWDSPETNRMINDMCCHHESFRTSRIHAPSKNRQPRASWHRKNAQQSTAPSENHERSVRRSAWSSIRRGRW